MQFPLSTILQRLSVFVFYSDKFVPRGISHPYNSIEIQLVRLDDLASALRTFSYRLTIITRRVQTSLMSARRLSLAAVGGNSTGTGDQDKKKGNSDGEHGGGTGGGGDHRGGDTGNGHDALDGLDGGVECCSLEEVWAWGSSFDKLMRSAAGRKLFREFLLSEYSEENIAFWLACEQLKRESNPEMVEQKARCIYEAYISILSPKEVSSPTILACSNRQS